MSEGKGRRVHIPISDLCHLCLQGVVPYLGTFLKDLVMLDAASKDELEVSVCVCVICPGWFNMCTSGTGRQPSTERLQAGETGQSLESGSVTTGSSSTSVYLSLYILVYVHQPVSGRDTCIRICQVLRACWKLRHIQFTKYTKAEYVVVV